MLYVYKYKIAVMDNLVIEMPEGAQILTIQTQFGVPRLWALVNPENPLIMRCFRLARTGRPISNEKEKLQHQGSFQLNEGSLIFHLFEIL